MKNWIKFYIKKNNGKKREITAPSDRYKAEQKKILNKLYKIYYPFQEFKWAYGGLPFKNIKLHAENHINTEILLRLDIKDFFPSINKEKLIEILQEDFKNKKVKNRKDLLSKIKKYCFYKGKIPQGAVTSPFLANIYLIEFDRIIATIMKRGYYNYSRYFDDLTFSYNPAIKIIDNLSGVKYERLEVGQIIKVVIFYLERLKLQLNYEKTRVMKIGRRQNVCNITTNQKININRKYYKLLRAVKHHFLNNKVATMSQQQYFGHLAFVQSINPDKLKSLNLYLGGEK